MSCCSFCISLLPDLASSMTQPSLSFKPASRSTTRQKCTQVHANSAALQLLLWQGCSKTSPGSNAACRDHLQALTQQSLGAVHQAETGQIDTIQNLRPVCTACAEGVLPEQATLTLQQLNGLVRQAVCGSCKSSNTGFHASTTFLVQTEDFT